MLSLDEILKNVVIIEEDPKKYISVYLVEPSDHKDILEVTDIEGVRGTIPIEGLKDSYKLEVGSWIRKRELKELENRNKGIKFVVRVA